VDGAVGLALVGRISVRGGGSATSHFGPHVQTSVKDPYRSVRSERARDMLDENIPLMQPTSAHRPVRFEWHPSARTSHPRVSLAAERTASKSSGRSGTDEGELLLGRQTYIGEQVNWNWPELRPLQGSGDGTPPASTCWKPVKNRCKPPWPCSSDAQPEGRLRTRSNRSMVKTLGQGRLRQSGLNGQTACGQTERLNSDVKSGLTWHSCQAHWAKFHPPNAIDTVSESPDPGSR